MAHLTGLEQDKTGATAVCRQWRTFVNVYICRYTPSPTEPYNSPTQSTRKTAAADNAEFQVIIRSSPIMTVPFRLTRGRQHVSPVLNPRISPRQNASQLGDSNNPLNKFASQSPRLVCKTMRPLSNCMSIAQISTPPLQSFPFSINPTGTRRLFPTLSQRTLLYGYLGGTGLLLEVLVGEERRDAAEEDDGVHADAEVRGLGVGVGDLRRVGLGGGVAGLSQRHSQRTAHKMGWLPGE